ncbi:hypothetical protein [Nocardiopsis sp. FR26]|uniref:hypothetical protein n=1 Tax=Nocardiopsis sp. FR26 TaxID=2605987 RepID=UPI00135C9240|nr:hypothetical protein [Nocardiopsis sp. FR26]
MAHTMTTAFPRPRDLAVPRKGDLAIIRTTDTPALYHLTRVARVIAGEITDLEQVNTGWAVPRKQWPRLGAVTWVATEEVNACGVIAMAPHLTTPDLSEITAVLEQHRRRNRPELVPDWVVREAGFGPGWSVTLTHEAMVAAASWIEAGPEGRWLQGNRLLALVTTVRKVVAGQHPREQLGTDVFGFAVADPDTGATTELVAAVGNALHPSVAVGVWSR